MSTFAHLTSVIIAGLGFTLAASSVAQAGNKSPQAGVRKYVSKQGNFVAYVPQGWTVNENLSNGCLTVQVQDPKQQFQATKMVGANLLGGDVLALAGAFVQTARRQYPDATLGNVWASQQQDCVAFEGTYMDPRRGPREFRCWVTGKGRDFVLSAIEAPRGRLTTERTRLLNIQANIRVMKGAVGSKPAVPTAQPLRSQRLSDGSAIVGLPAGWTCRTIGAGAFVAEAPNGGGSFCVASVSVISPRLGVRVPGAFISERLQPAAAVRFLGQQSGLATAIRFEEIKPRADLAAQMRRVYTVGPVDAAELVYTFTAADGNRRKGYSLAVSLGTRLQTNWALWHMSVSAPVGQFDAMLPTFVAMIESFRVDDQFAMNYVAQGMARLRQLQKETAAKIAQNARDIRAMMQAAYDERQRSQDYIDYIRTQYIRGESDWISTVEGGAVYHTDSWGTRNTATGEYYQGSPYDYVRFRGKNPKYNELMTPINSRLLFERYVARQQ